MDIKESTVDGVKVVSVSGRLDAETSPELCKKLNEQLESKNNTVVLDLSSLEYISSAGLRVVLEITKRARVIGGELYLVNLQDYVRKVLEISGLISFLKILKSVDDLPKK